MKGKVQKNRDTLMPITKLRVVAIAVGSKCKVKKKEAIDIPVLNRFL